jgi:hypothetical protein
MINIRVIKAILKLPPIASIEPTKDGGGMKELGFDVLVSQYNVGFCKYKLGEKSADEWQFDIEKMLGVVVQMYPDKVNNKRACLTGLYNLAVETGDQDGAGELKQLIDNTK